MARFAFIAGLIAVGLVSAPKVTWAGKSSAKYNVKCPAPKLCRKVERARDVCLLNEEMCDSFVDLFAQMIPTYDCTRSPEGDPKPSLMPAIWMCDNLHSGFTFSALAQVKSLKGQRLYASPFFRSCLAGPVGATHYGASIEREKKLRAEGVIR